MSPEVVHLLDRAAPWLILWSFAFTLIHGVRIVVEPLAPPCEDLEPGL